MATIQLKTGKLAVSIRETYVDDEFIINFSQENNMSEEYVGKMLVELSKFLFLSTVSKKPISPSVIIDKIWHALILWDTEKYQKLCKGLTGQMVHHKRTSQPYPRENLYKIAKEEHIFLTPEFWTIHADPNTRQTIIEGDLVIVRSPYSDADCG